jgi:ABC-2 type transport system permease protein
MRGGAVIVAGSNYRVTLDPFTGALALQPIEDGLAEMLTHYGVNVEKTLVLDPQNEPFPITVNRQVGSFSVQELQSINYPFFVDVRNDGMSKESSIIASLPAVTLNWVSPVRVDEVKNAGREVATLLRSSPASWLRSELDIQPNTELYPELGFPVGAEQAAQPLAVSIRGSFDSYFAGKPSPLENSGGEGAATPARSALGAIEKSPDTARLAVIGSGDFLNDTVFTISSQLSFDRYLNSLQFIQNAVDWSVEDMDLLSIRSRGAYARVLDPLEPSEQSFWEFTNYALALLALVVIGGLWAAHRRNEKPMAIIPSSQLEQGHI